MGMPPRAQDSPAQMARILVDGRDQLLVAFFCAGVALAPLIWFLSALHSWMRDIVPGRRGQELANTAFTSGLLAITLMGTGSGVFLWSCI